MPSALSAQVQTEPIKDTLPAAVKIVERGRDSLGVAIYHLDPVRVKRLVSPMGEGDAIKLVQTLPGVSTGGEGGSALYVRGGNMGSNLMSLDGNPIYGVSHLLGLAFVIPQEILSEMTFRSGGFLSEESNLTASHIRLKTQDGDFESPHFHISATPFMVGGTISTPIVRNQLAALGSVRFSPLGLEYKLLRPLVNKHQSIVNDFGTTVGDVFGKVTWRKDADNSLSLSVLGSMDYYRFALNEQSSDIMSWSNLLVNASWNRQDIGGLDALETTVSYNRHIGSQAQETTLGGRYCLSQLRNSLNEWMLASTAYKKIGDRSALTFGIKARGAHFSPGASHYYEGSSSKEVAVKPMADASSGTFLMTLHGQWSYEVPKKFMARLALRGNAYVQGQAGHSAKKWYFNPEASLVLRWNVLPVFGLEATFDALAQYYHTLEGVPLGWSVDMTVPSDARLAPERAMQEYLGFFGAMGQYSFRLGAFYKQMNNLVYYNNASLFFDMSQSGWHDNISVGEGTSYGMEFFHEKRGRDLTWSVSYTLSKTDRFFPGLNENKRFPAKYDRRHIANVSADWTFLRRKNVFLGINTLFTYQSGNWETIQDGTVFGYFIGKKEPIPMPLVSSLNNYELPDIIRWDAGFHIELNKGRCAHEWDLGVYNILNRHNPSFLHYDSEKEQWFFVSLFPMMPTLSYRLQF